LLIAIGGQSDSDEQPVETLSTQVILLSESAIKIDCRIGKVAELFTILLPARNSSGGSATTRDI
jgi:hypothetical protein